MGNFENRLADDVLYKLLTFKDLGDERGKLVVIEGERDIPFKIARAFYIYGSDSSVVRGKHANRNSEFILVNVAGSSKVMITDGTRKEIVELNRPMEAVYIPKMFGITTLATSTRRR